MRNQIVWLTAIFIVFMGFSLSQGQVVNLLENGGFETGDMAPWTTYGGATTEVVTDLTGAAVPEDPIEGTHALHITITALGDNFYSIGLQHRGHNIFEQGKKYTLSAFLKCSSGTLDINFKPEHDGDPWVGYGEQAFTMTEEWQEFSTTTDVMT
ncbi:MAG: carbohydrate binding domain-containing protein, partial [Planctomycetota bacterium]